MFRFEHPEFFWLLAFPLCFFLFYALRNRWSGMDWKRWAHPVTIQRVQASLGKPGYSILIVCGMVLLTIAAVNPQWGLRKVEIESKTADIYLLLDISNSMLAEDIAPSRLEKARRLALELSTTFRSDKVGLILFAGNAYIQSPLTTDWHAIQLFLNAADPSQAGTQGTAIGDAVRLAVRSKENEDRAAQGAMIIITDGEDHDDDALESVEAAASAGWTTYVIGAGTQTGATIPIQIDGRKDVKRDETGQPVRTALNETLLQQLASAGGGTYYNLDQHPAIAQSLTADLASLERTQIDKRAFSEYRSFFQYFLITGLAMMIFSFMLHYKWEWI